MRYCLILFCFSPLFAVAQIGAKTKQPNVQGIWINNEFGFQMTLILNVDGTGEFDGEAIKYNVNGDNLVLTNSGTSYKYLLRENTLTLSGGDLEKQITFSRQGSNPGSSPQVANADKPNASPSIPKDLLGIWAGYNQTIEFKSDGSCIFQGQLLSFSASSNTITLTGPNGSVQMNYLINGDKISFTSSGQSFVYTRGGSKSEPAKSVATKGVDGTIVGKWCYMNVYSSSTGGSSSSECITLHQNGTYEYYSESSRSVNTGDVSGGTASQGSDQGTWWIEGDRIFYHSNTTGAGSYQLAKQNHPKTNDPMIVLDGKTFVTFYQKAPW